jgi:very-short-patch-repair endonuclease
VPNARSATRHARLAGLFEDEVTLQLGALGPTPRVDLLWRDGKVVVELDGAEHERAPNYSADRHRDYELLVAGYLVLRLTNAEVELDLGRSLEKVRRVVNLRRVQL